MRSQNAKNTPKVEPPKDTCPICYLEVNVMEHEHPELDKADEVMSKFWAIFDKHFPQPITGNLPAFEKEVETLLKLQQEALLDRVEAGLQVKKNYIPGTDREYINGGNDMLDATITTINKLRLEL